MARFEALTGGVFDRLNCQHRGEFDRGLPGGRMGGFGIDRYITVALFLHYSPGFWRVPPQYWSMQFLFAVYEKTISLI